MIAQSTTLHMLVVTRTVYPATPMTTLAAILTDKHMSNPTQHYEEWPFHESFGGWVRDGGSRSSGTRFTRYHRQRYRTSR